MRCERNAPDAIPQYDLEIAAGAFSRGQIPSVIAHFRIDGVVPELGAFIARVVGDSMDKVAGNGAWCLWQELGKPGVAAEAPQEKIVVRRPDGPDPELGEFTFKRFVETERGRALVPASTNPAHKPIPLGEEHEIEAVARFIDVVEEGPAR